MKHKLLNKLLTLTLLILGGALFSPAWGEDIVVTLDNIGAGLGSTANTTAATTSITATGTSNSYTLNYYQCKKQGNAMLMTKSVSPYISNKTAMPGNIKSVQVFINSGASAKTTYDCAFSTTECASAQSGIGAVKITGGNSHTFSNMTGKPEIINVKGKYFCITLGNANNGQVLKLVITCENSHTLTYSATNGTIAGVDAGSNAVASGASVAENATVTLTATPSDGYEFSSWEVSGTGSTLSSTSTNPTTFTMGTADATVTANFTATGGTTTYSVTYNANDATSGDVPTDNNEYEEGDKVTVLGNTGSLVKTGHAFSGWNTQANGEGTTYAASETFNITGNTTLYAKWTPYTITAQSNNNTYGTVTLSKFVITGSPAPGYRYADPAYSVTSGSASVAQEGDEFTVTPTSDCTVRINFEAIPKHTATFSVNGSTTSQDFAEGASITFPEDPDDVSGKKFVGWATDAISGTTDEAPSFVTSATMGNEDITYYAVFADAEESSETKQDALTSSVTGITTSSYTNFSDKSVSGGSNATYAGNCAGSNSYIQLRTSSNTGLVSTTSGGKVKKVTLVWNSTSDRALHIYGSNTAYTGISDIFDDKKKGTLLGTLTYNSDTELSITGNYAYIGIKPDANKSGASQLSSITIDWEVSNITYSNYCTSVVVAYSVTYDGNGATSGSVPTDETAYSPNATVTVLGNTGNLVYTGYAFSGWNTKSDGSGDNYDKDDTFEITANTTLYAKWVPYEITAVSNNESYGTVSREGLVITGSPKSGYRYASPAYSVTSGSATVAQEGNEFTVTPASDCTVQINFEEIPTHAITYSVNGITTTVNVIEGEDVDLSAPTSGVPTGYAFKGWRTSTLAVTDTDPDDYITSATSTADITYYAVLAIETKNPTTTHLTGDEIASVFAASGMAYADAEKSYSDTSEDMTWGARCTTNTGRHWIQLRNDNDTYIKAVAPQNITGVKVQISNAKNESGGIDDISKHGAFSAEVNLDKVQNTNSGACGSAASSAINNNYLTISADGTSNIIYIHVTGAARVWSVDVTYNATTFSGYCTTIPPVAVTVTASSYATFASDFPLDFTDKEIKAYIAKAKDDGTGVTFERVYKIPAETGVLLYKDGGTTEAIPVFDPDKENADNTDGNVFVRGEGVAVASEDDNKRNYILSKVNNVVGFYRANNKVVAKNRAYIQVESASLAKDFISMPGFDDSTTGVTEVNGSGLMVNGPVYDLQGRRVEKPGKGLYIVNGKKVLKY